MDAALYHTAHRAFFFPSLVQFDGAPDVAAFIQLSECRPRSPQLALHVFQEKQFHQQVGVGAQNKSALEAYLLG